MTPYPTTHSYRDDIMTQQRKSTMVELVEELQALPPSPEIDEMIAEAKAGEYHDYKNRKYVCGKMAVYGKLKAAGLDDLANRITAGEFDEEADAEDIKNMREELGEGPEAEAMAKALGLDQSIH